MEDNVSSSSPTAVEQELIKYRNENQRLQHDQQVADSAIQELESQLTSLTSSHQLIINEKNRLHHDNEELQRRVAELSKVIASTTGKVEDALRAQQKAELQSKLDKELADEMTATADRKQQAIDRYTEEIRLRNERLREANTTEHRLETEVRDLRSQLRPLQLKIERYEEEKQIILKDKDNYVQQYEETRNKYFELQKQSATKEAELSAQIEHYRYDTTSKDNRIDNLTKEINLLTSQIQSLQATNTETTMAAERRADKLERVIEKYKSFEALTEISSKASTERISQLETLIEQTRSEATVAIETAHNEAQTMIDQMKEEFNQKLEAAQQATTKAEELRNSAMNELQECKEQYNQELTKLQDENNKSPAAEFLSALRADKSSGSSTTLASLELLRRMTQTGTANEGDESAPATAFYAHIQALETNLMNEKQKNTELLKHLNRVLTEIERKAPDIQQQRINYERALVAHEDMSRRLAMVMRDNAKLTSEVGIERDARERSEQRIITLQGTINDLRKQLVTFITPSSGSMGNGLGTSLLDSTDANNTLGQWPTDDNDLIQMVSGNAATSSNDKSSLIEAQRIIDESLLTFKDVVQLQERNQQLLRVLRSMVRNQPGGLSSSSMLNNSGGKGLSSSNADSTGLSSGTSAIQAVRTLKAEITELQRARETQAAMVATIVQQRDMYKLLLSQTNADIAAQGDDLVSSNRVSAFLSGTLVNSPAGGSGMEMDSAIVSSSSRPRGSPLGPSSSSNILSLSRASASSSGSKMNNSMRANGDAQVQEATSMAAMATATADSLTHMLEDTRAELERVRSDAREQIKFADQRVNELRDELLELKKSLAQATAEAKYSEQRVHHLEEAATASKNEATRERQHILEIQQSIVQYQKDIKERDISLNQVRKELTTFRTQVISLEAERDNFIASENRLKTALAESAQERDRLSHLVDSIRTLEASVAARETAERQSLAEDRTRLQREWMTARQALDDERLLATQRAQVHAGELRDAARRYEEANESLQSSRTEAATLRGEADGLRGQIASLQQQLLSLQNNVEHKVMALGNRKDMETSRLAILETEIQSLQTELNGARDMLTQKDQHIYEYRTLAAAAEDTLRNKVVTFEKLLSESKERETALAKETEEFRQQLHTVQEDLDKERRNSMSIAETQFKREDELRNEVTKLQGEIRTYEGKVESATRNEDNLRNDIRRIEELRNTAENSYNTLLQNLASDSRSFKESREKVAQLDEELNKLRDELARNQATLLAQQQTANSREQALNHEITHLRSSADEYKAQNAILLSQVGSLSAELDRTRAETVATSASHDGSAEIDETGKGTEELQASRKRERELREVTNFWRHQSETNAAKADLAQEQVRSLEERLRFARIEAETSTSTSRRLQEQLDAIQSAAGATGISLGSGTSSSSTTSISSPMKSSNIRILSVEEHQRLLESTTQVSLLQESYRLLRDECARKVEDLKQAEETVSKLEKSVAPLEQQARMIQNERDQWTIEKQNYEKQLVMWRNRLDSVFSRRDTIDPAAHRAALDEVSALQGQVTILKKSLTDLRTAMDEQTTTLNNLKAEAESKIQVLSESTAEVERLTKENEALNESKAQFRTMALRNRKDAETKIAALETELSSLKKAGTASPAVKGGDNSTASTAAAVKAANDETAKAKAALDTANQEITTLRAELETTKQALAEAEQQVAARTNEVTDLEAAVTKLRELNRNYKNLYEKTLQALKEVKNENETLKAEKTTTTSLTTEMSPSAPLFHPSAPIVEETKAKETVATPPDLPFKPLRPSSTTPMITESSSTTTTTVPPPPKPTLSFGTGKPRLPIPTLVGKASDTGTPSATTTVTSTSLVTPLTKKFSTGTVPAETTTETKEETDDKGKRSSFAKALRSRGKVTTPVRGQTPPPASVTVESTTVVEPVISTTTEIVSSANMADSTTLTSAVPLSATEDDKLRKRAERFARMNAGLVTPSTTTVTDLPNSTGTSGVSLSSASVFGTGLKRKLTDVDESANNSPHHQDASSSSNVVNSTSKVENISEEPEAPITKHARVSVDLTNDGNSTNNTMLPLEEGSNSSNPPNETAATTMNNQMVDTEQQEVIEIEDNGVEQGEEEEQNDEADNDDDDNDEEENEDDEDNDDDDDDDEDDDDDDDDDDEDNEDEDDDDDDDEDDDNNDEEAAEDNEEEEAAAAE